MENEFVRLPRYAVFAGENYYPLSGDGNLIGVYASLETAESVARALKARDGSVDWTRIVDLARWYPQDIG
jgi:hypothetical protein